jgi:hypothetical protein
MKKQWAKGFTQKEKGFGEQLKYLRRSDDYRIMKMHKTMTYDSFLGQIGYMSTLVW